MPVLAILLVGQAMASMDASILVVAAPSLRADLRASDAQLQLVVAMYTITFASLVVTGARLGDVLGRRRAFLLGLAGFTLFSLAGGLAPTPGALIVARGLQGAAGALMTPQVLSIIQLEFTGESRARAIRAYSMVLALGVAAGQILGGLLVGAHLLTAEWRPALLLNAPIGALFLIAAHRHLPHVAFAPGAARRLDCIGAPLLDTALLAFVVPLTVGRDAGWPLWVWPSLAGCFLALAAFIVIERRVQSHDADALFDFDVLRRPGVTAGIVAVMLVMASYAGFLVSLTLHLQDHLGFAPLHAGAIFAIYAAGFATTSLTWAHTPSPIRVRLPMVGPLLMAAALLGVGLSALTGGWPPGLTVPLLFAGGAGHAAAFSPLTSGLATAVHPGQAADLSGLILTASLVGQVIGVAIFAGVYLGAAPRGSANALALTTGVEAPALAATAASVQRAITRLRPATSERQAAAGPDQRCEASTRMAPERPWRDPYGRNPRNRR
jgi:MFS family permease